MSLTYRSGAIVAAPRGLALDRSSLGVGLLRKQTFPRLREDILREYPRTGRAGVTDAHESLLLVRYVLEAAYEDMPFPAYRQGAQSLGLL